MGKSTKNLRKNCQGELKIKDWVDDWYNVYFGRRVSWYITKVLMRTGITANKVTLIHLFMGILAAVFLAFGNYTYSILGVVLMHLSYIFDLVDGEIARYRKTQSWRGKYIDFLAFDVITTSIIFSVSLGLYNSSHVFFGFDTYHNVWVIIFGYVSSSFYLLTTLAATRAPYIAYEGKTSLRQATVHTNEENDKREAPQDSVQAKKPKRKFEKVYFLLRLFPNLITIISVGVIFNFSIIILFVFCLVMPAVWAVLSYSTFLELPTFVPSQSKKR